MVSKRDTKDAINKRYAGESAAEYWEKYRRVPKLAWFLQYPFAYKLLRALKHLLEAIPPLYVLVFRFMRRGFSDAKKYVSKYSDIVIEGYPRSANSFARAAFKKAQTENLWFSGHIHSVAIVREACRLRKPCIVLIRDPRQVILSAAVYAYQEKAVASWMSREYVLRQMLGDWLRFYRPVPLLRDLVVIADFKEVTNDFGSVIDRVNTKFGTKFKRFEHNAASQQEIFESNAAYLSPSESREVMKAELGDVWAKVQKTPQFAEACRLYEKLTYVD